MVAGRVDAVFGAAGAVCVALLVLSHAAVAAAGPMPYRIGVRVVEGNGEFYDTATDAKFVPRGVDFIGFVSVLGIGYHDRLLATNIFDPGRSRGEFGRLAARGYNTIRIFFDHCNQGPECLTPAGSGSAPTISTIWPS